MNTCLLALALTLGCADAPTHQDSPSFQASGLEDRWLAEDKLRHFALSFAATQMTYGGARAVAGHDAAAATAVVTAVSLGLAKELRDRNAGQHFSLKDLAWDMGGVALGFALIRSIR